MKCCNVLYIKDTRPHSKSYQASLPPSHHPFPIHPHRTKGIKTKKNFKIKINDNILQYPTYPSKDHRQENPRESLALSFQPEGCANTSPDPGPTTHKG